MLPYWGPGLQPRHLPWLGIKPMTLWFAGWRAIQWATPGGSRHSVLSSYFNRPFSVFFINGMSTGIPLSYKGCNSNLLFNIEWLTNVLGVSTLWGFEIMHTHKLACCLLDQRFHYLQHSKQHEHRVGTGFPCLSSSSQLESCTCSGFVSQFRNTELGESTAFTVNENKPFVWKQMLPHPSRLTTANIILRKGLVKERSRP